MFSRRLGIERRKGKYQRKKDNVSNNIEGTEESTTATQGYTDEGRQGIADALATVRLQLIQEDPLISKPGRMDRMVTTGPMHDRGDILELFRGRPISLQTTTRVANNSLRDLPISTELPEHERVGVPIPGADRYIGWWAPRVVGEGPIYQVHVIPKAGGALYRYPRENEHTEDFFRGDARARKIPRR